jgi:O-antigen/teichoic acid export membrane protein
MHNFGSVKVLEGTAIAVVGEAVSVTTIYAVSIVIARVVGAAGMGTYAQAMAVITLGILVAQMGLDLGVLRMISLYRVTDDLPHLKGSVVFSTRAVSLLGFVVAIVIFFSAGLLATRVFSDNQLIFVLRAISVTVPILAVRSIWLNVAQGFDNTIARILVGKVFAPVGNVVVLLGLLTVWGNSWGAIVVANVLSAFTSCILAYAVYRHLVRVRLKLSATTPQYDRKGWYSFSVPLWLGQLLSSSLPRLTLLLLGYFANSSQVGIFEIACKLALLVQLPLDMAGLIVAPRLADLVHKDQLRQLTGLMGGILQWMLVICVLLFIALFLFVEPLLRLFGNDFGAGVPLVHILIIGHLINVVTGPVGILLVVSGRSKLHMVNAISAFLLNIGLSLILIPALGSRGAAWSVTIGEIALNIARFIEVLILFGIGSYLFRAVKPLTSGVLTYMGFIVAMQISKFDWDKSLSSIALAALTLLFLYILSVVPMYWKELVYWHHMISKELRTTPNEKTL